MSRRMTPDQQRAAREARDAAAPTTAEVIILAPFLSIVPDPVPDDEALVFAAPDGWETLENRR